jgi:hypothetical protein
MEVVAKVPVFEEINTGSFAGQVFANRAGSDRQA